MALATMAAADAVAHVLFSQIAVSIFDKDNSGTLNAGEIRTIFNQVQNSSDKNTQDKRSNEYAILDGSEAEHFISQNKDNDGNTYKDLGVDISQVFNFFNVLKNNYVERQEEVQEDPEGNSKCSGKTDDEYESDDPSGTEDAGSDHRVAG